MLRKKQQKETSPPKHSRQYKNANILAIYRGEGGCVLEFHSSCSVINSEIILLSSFSETILDQGLFYAMQSKINQMLEFQFVCNIPPGEELRFIFVSRSKTSIRMQVYLKVAAGSIELEKVNLTHQGAAFLADYYFL